MSRKIGPIAVMPAESNGPLLPGASDVSSATRELIDSEVRRIVEDAHVEVTQLLTDNRDRLESITAALLERETLDEEETYAAARVSRPAREEDASGSEAPSVAASDAPPV
jgi:cell division protease FtsH